MEKRHPRLRALLLVACLPWAIACGDFVSAVQERVEDAPLAERPEGWESRDDEGAVIRTYYQFVDANRNVRFVERLEDVPEALRAGVGFVELDVPPPLSPGDAARARAARLQGGTRSTAVASADARIVLYSAEWCEACRKARRYLDQRGIAYEVRDIDEPRYADELLGKTGKRAVPVIDVDGRVLTGFSAKGYDRLIDRA